MRLHTLSEIYIGVENINGRLDNEGLATLAKEMQPKFQSPNATYFFNRKRYNCFIEYKDNEAIRQLGREAIHQIRSYYQQVYADPMEYELQLQGWAMVQGWGEFVMPHHHNGHHFSAVYYVDVPPVKDSPIQRSGNIFFHNSSPLARSWIPRTSKGEQIHVAVDVKAGDFVIFPAHLLHSVSPWYGEKERICYAMNFFLKREHDWEEMLSENDL
jgi:hypothetical protein